MKQLREIQLNSPYNKEAVVYCKNCLSLNIRIIGEESDNFNVCYKCNRTDVDTTDIYTWREMYKNKYGKYPEED